MKTEHFNAILSPCKKTKIGEIFDYHDPQNFGNIIKQIAKWNCGCEEVHGLNEKNESVILGTSYCTV